MATILLNEEPIETIVRQFGDSWFGIVEGETGPLAWEEITPNHFKIWLGDEETAVTLVEHNGTYFVHGYGRSWTITPQNPLTKAGAGAGDSANAAIAPMPGTVVSINVQAGDEVTQGSIMMTIESMKMLTDITAPRDGMVEEVHLAEGATFDKGATLVTLEA